MKNQLITSSSTEQGPDHIQTPTIIRISRELGFALVGVTTAEPVAGFHHLRHAISSARIGSMSWLGRNPEARCDPRALLPGARSVICCALAYGEDEIEESGTGNLVPEIRNRLSRFPVPGSRSRVSTARFARGADYHVVVRKKLEQLWDLVRKHAPDARAKFCVDTSPILEKALAARAGLGWIGKHTLLLNRELGSWFVLGEIITDLEIEPDASVDNLCGDCRACLDACPTGALVAPHTLDARRCISYLTIEHKDEVPEELRRFIPEDAYGCDLCQLACPYNRGR